MWFIQFFNNFRDYDFLADVRNFTPAAKLKQNLNSWCLNYVQGLERFCKNETVHFCQNCLVRSNNERAFILAKIFNLSTCRLDQKIPRKDSDNLEKNDPVAAIIL